jgi:hypothetical protein
MTALTRESMLAAAAQPRPAETMDVPELGGAVTIRAMSGKERDAFESAIALERRRHVTTTNVRARLAVACLVDDQGQRLLTDADADALGELRADVLDRICSIAQRLSGFVSADLAELVKLAALDKSA